MSKPTQQTYAALTQAYDFFNAELFGGKLPDCLITIVRKRKAKGYFWQEKFKHTDTGEATDEISLNPELFSSQPLEQTMSTLVHEMCHLQQHHFGKPSRSGYHNKQWAEYMVRVGLHPSDTGAEGGKETGQRMTHYIIEGGIYADCYKALVKDGFKLDWINKPSLPEGIAKAKKKNASKTKYTCDGCELNVWAKPDANIMCGDCDQALDVA